MDKLPVECISCILASMSPKDVCKLAGVSTAFKAAADSNLLWRTFLPPDYREFIAQSPSSSFLNSMSEKALYFHLSDNPILIGTGKLSIALKKESGGKCYMISLMDIETATARSYRTWKSVPQSRFLEVACIKFETLVRIRGRIKAKNLSPKTHYGVYFVFNFKCMIEQLMHVICSMKPILSHIYIDYKEIRRVTLDACEGFVVKREDGWMEIDMGQFFNEGDEDDVFISFNIRSVSRSMGEILLEGVEFRPMDVY